MVCLTSFLPTRLRSDVALRAWQMAMARVIRTRHGLEL